MNKLLCIRDLSFAYRNALSRAVDQLNFSIDEGEFVGITGSTGAGKSTLIRACTGIVPKFSKGPFRGTVEVNGKDIKHLKTADLAGTVGTVFQDFEAQLFSTNVAREMAFGMENLCIDRARMWERIHRISDLVGLSGLLDREPQSLSGGQKQRLALASVLCLEPRLLLCDEPTTDLDPAGKNKLLDILQEISRSGHGVGLVELDSERLVRADRIITLQKGRIVAEGPPAKVFADPKFCRDNGLFPPQLFELFALLGLAERPVETVQAKKILDQTGFVLHEKINMPETLQGAPIITVRDLCFSYNPQRPVLQNINLDIHQGDFVALLGQNGSGKTTLVQQIVDLLTPSQGQVCFHGKPVKKIGISHIGKKIGFVFQNPDQMIFAANVYEEVAFGLGNFGFDKKEIADRVGAALETVGLSGREKTDPFVMTKGERQKLAVAGVLACEPEVLIMDEPTTGLDADEQTAMMDLLCKLNRKGHTIIIITHSVEIVAGYAGRVVLLDGGRIIGDGPTAKIFARQALLEKAGLMAPACVRLSGLYGQTALTVSELAGQFRRGHK